LRRVVLLSIGVPASEVQAIGVDIFGHPVSTAVELTILATFALVMVVLAARLFATLD